MAYKVLVDTYTHSKPNLNLKGLFKINEIPVTPNPQGGKTLMSIDFKTDREEIEENRRLAQLRGRYGL